MIKWFKGVKTVEELRKRYKELLRTHHPDNGGNVSDMQEINAEYDALFERLSKEETKDSQSYGYDKTEENKAFKEVLSKVININADVEICGEWIWIEKGSYEYRELLKECGFHYASRKKAWYWHFGTYNRISKREISLDEIRQKYGSTKVNHRTKQFVIS